VVGLDGSAGETSLAIRDRDGVRYDAHDHALLRRQEVSNGRNTGTRHASTVLSPGFLPDG
jgi:hypothetical protein